MTIGSLSGVLVVAKEPGPTSHDIVALVRRLSGVKRVGHGGTLDPFAAGVLPVFVGRATRLVEYHLADEKEYRALVCFAARSTTDDRDGELTPGEAPGPGREQVETALAAFVGEIEQVPPDYSAVRIGGRRAYELARHGRKPELRPRRVTIKSLTLSEWDETDPDRPIGTVELHCSAGTYVRALARDLGEKLGCGAYLGALTRTASGPFRLGDAHSLERVREALGSGRSGEILLPPDAGLESYPRLALEPSELDTLARGQPVRLHDAIEDGLLRIVDQQGRLAAMARNSQGVLHPEKVFHSLAG
ncbi:tRNA pseudouridine(55) synthase TruB [soil metagenome]